MSSVRELLRRKRANPIETRGAGRAERGTLFMVHDLSDRREIHDRQLSFAAKIYIDTAVIVL